MSSDVKKLKVAELRAALQERGLDSKGLKAELVSRLISALEAGAGPIKSAQENPYDEGDAPKQTRQSNTASNKVIPSGSSCQVVVDHQAQLEESGPGLLAAPRTLPCVDRGTQTEQDSTVHTCCCSNERAAGSLGSSENRLREQLKTNVCNKDGYVDKRDVSNVDDADPQAQQAHVKAGPAEQGPAAGDEDPVPKCSSSVTSSLVWQPDLVFPTKDNDQLSCRLPEPLETAVERQGECRTVTQPHGERGRDYYEFKEEIHYNRAKTPEPGPVSDNEMEMETEVDGDVVRLDPYNSDLHFAVGTDGGSGQPLLWETVPLLWSGCRLTHGFTRGKVGFEVKFEKRLCAASVDVPPDRELWALRVGWSVEDSSLQLGEEELSFAWDGAGLAVSGGRAEEFGEPFSEGDVIGCYAFIGEDGQAELSFHKNGHSFGVAFRPGPASLAGRALYPHVLCQNCSVSVNLDLQGVVWFPGPPGYCPLPSLPPALRTRGPMAPAHRRDCEVLLMVGMPASGKSCWVQSHMAKNPEKRYSVISTESVLHCMKLSSSKDKEFQLQQATRCLSQLIHIAPHQRRNFILDQANIYPSARRHKMLRFRGYQRKAVVVVPSNEEWKRRLCQQQQHEGTAVPETSLLKSKVSFTLPEQGDLLEEVLFVELSREEAQKLLSSYKEEARQLLPQPLKRKKPRNSRLQPLSTPYSTACGVGQNLFNRHAYDQQSQWGHQKRPGRPLCVCAYGRSSDLQWYGGYYQPWPGQWNFSDQNQGYYGNQDYYYSNQGFW